MKLGRFSLKASPLFCILGSMIGSGVVIGIFWILTHLNQLFSTSFSSLVGGIFSGLLDILRCVLVWFDVMPWLSAFVILSLFICVICLHQHNYWFKKEQNVVSALFVFLFIGLGWGMIQMGKHDNSQIVQQETKQANTWFANMNLQLHASARQRFCTKSHLDANDWQNHWGLFQRLDASLPPQTNNSAILIFHCVNALPLVYGDPTDTSAPRPISPKSYRFLRNKGWARPLLQGTIWKSDRNIFGYMNPCDNIDNDHCQSFSDITVWTDLKKHGRLVQQWTSHFPISDGQQLKGLLVVKSDSTLLKATCEKSIQTIEPNLKAGLLRVNGHVADHGKHCHWWGNTVEYVYGIVQQPALPLLKQMAHDRQTATQAVLQASKQINWKHVYFEKAATPSP